MAIVALEIALQCAMPSARIFRNKRNEDQPLVRNEQAEGPSSVTVIGVPACSALEPSRINLNKSLLWNRKFDV